MRSQNSDLFKKATELVYSNPDEAIKIGEHILKTTEDAKLKASIDVMVAKAYFIKGDYKNAIEYVYKAGGNQVAFSDYETQISINLLKAKLFRLLYLDTQHEQYLKNAERLLPKIIVKKRRDSLSSCVFLEKISMHLERQRMDEAQSLLDKTSAQFYDFIGSHSVLKGKLYIVEEKVLSNKAEYDSALVYLNKALALTTSEGYNNSYEKAQIYNQLGYLYLQKGAFKKSEEMLFIALRFAEVLGNPFLSEKINKNLSINYLTSNQKNKYKVYNDEFLVLNNKMELIEQESVSTAYSIISNENETYLAQEEEKYSNYRQIILMYISLIVLVGLFFLIKSQWKKKRLKDIVKYLEISRNNFIETRLSNKMPAKRIIIPEDTEKSILAKLKCFESSKKYLRKDMSLPLLAGEFETNTKYLSEIIHKHYNDNYNTFINKLRINYIIEMLKSDTNYINYKISFLAEESGFSSHSSFATVFKAIIGMSPVTFINFLKTERKGIKKEFNA